ncbi:hypothetical protein [Gilvimarinus algae]|uniref:Uncharacterized protein n=1 Tax=Gilvimarinus algae TaxID=3058037 RepID=A0ABT8TMX1_9GAMM|nr:hypothetical protein [Gilvimarinus sp. SDUM040014]MDO3383996.1 hypothetical protein [Gilvimarinus sp. SDUM040014]
MERIAFIGRLFFKNEIPFTLYRAFFFVFISFLPVFAWSNPLTGADSGYCPAGQVSSTSRPQRALDYSCAITFASLSDDLDSYQLIDSSSGTNPPVSGGWKIPVSKFRQASFLQGRRLLVIQESFRRSALSRICQLSREADLDISVAVGKGWPPEIQRALYPSLELSANELFLEYHLGDLDLVASSPGVSRQLMSIGLSNHRLQDGMTYLKASKGAFSAPIVIISDPFNMEPKSVSRKSGAYSVEGGVQALAAYNMDAKKTHQGQSGNRNDFSCAVQ